MSRFNKPLRLVLVSAAAALVLPAMPAFSQAGGNSSGGNSAADSSSMQSDSTSGTSGATSRSARRANAKAAHAKNKAELGKLEKNGYKPTAQEPDYPNNIQNAEKKTNGQ